MSGGHQLHHETPTIPSMPISRRTGLDVYLKLDNLQPPGSFKIRGVGNMCKKAVARGCTHIYCASGGNGGMAAAYAAKKLGVPATIVIPESSPSSVATNLRHLGANVLIHGKVFDNAKDHAIELASQPNAVFITPFDHPDVWEGHESLIEEASTQMPVKPDVVITCVGGGGLLNGIVQGMHKVGWKDVPVVAMETVGANCFNEAIKAGKIITLPDITSVCHSLGALTVSERTFEMYTNKEHDILSVVVEDKDAINACLLLAEDHRMLVEPACGAALSALYSGVISKLQGEGRLGQVKTALAVVCGGAAVSLEQLQNWKKQFNL